MCIPRSQKINNCLSSSSSFLFLSHELKEVVVFPAIEGWWFLVLLVASKVMASVVVLGKTGEVEMKYVKSVVVWFTVKEETVEMGLV